MTTYISDLLSATRHYPILHSQFITYRCSAKHILAVCKLWVKLHEALESYESQSGLTYSETGEIRPDDVRDVYASCVMHRLRYREEKDRLSAFWEHKNPDSADAAAEDLKSSKGGSGSARKDNDAKQDAGEEIEMLPSLEAIIEHMISTV